MAAGKMIISFFMVVLLLVGLMAMFTVKQTELALMLRFGKVVSGDFDPGLHFKVPFIIQIRKFDKRIQTLDAPPEHFLTSEKKNLIVDSFIKWRIVDVVTYFKSVGGNPQRAGRRLAEVIADGLRSEFGKRTIQEVVSGDRSEIMDIITEKASERATKFGISIIDVRIKRIELPTEVSTSVYRRMEAERERDARQLRSQGEAEAVRIKAGADRKSIEMIAKAERDAERIRGEGDGKTTNIYAQAYTQNAEFYSLYRSLNAYKTSFSNRNDLLVIQPDSDFFSYFNNLNGKNVMTPVFQPAQSEESEAKTSQENNVSQTTEVTSEEIVSEEKTGTEREEANLSEESTSEEKEVTTSEEETAKDNTAASEEKEVITIPEESTSEEKEVTASQEESSSQVKEVETLQQEEPEKNETGVN
ncbi:Band 7 protein [Beggiatoa sp. PS]|nr:Band 7 protein [Beggiatoa sp. PS]